MSEADPTKAEKQLSPSQQKLKDLVTVLATQPGATPDVVRSGSLELWPGRQLVAEVIDSRVILEEPGPSEEELLFALSVQDKAGHELESVVVASADSHTTVTVEESEPYGDNPTGAPDYAIDSFFDRYWLGNVAAAAVS